MKKELTRITTFFGIDNQIEKLKEEIKELIDAINEYEDYLDDENRIANIKTECKYREHIAEEIADVQNIIEGFIGLYMIKDELLNSIRVYKMNRTNCRNEVGYYKNL